MMDFSIQNLRKDEQIPLLLGQMYERFGYLQFKMEKFEEYDFYIENKSFLKSQKFITFQNSDGKLRALKPDITLSIVKNTNADENNADRRFYNEKVYRPSSSSNEIKEIAQTGLEYIGKVDVHIMTEVLNLAIRSLEVIDKDCVLDIANVDYLDAMLDEITDKYSVKKKLIACFGQKNAHGIEEICAVNDIAEADVIRLKRLVEISGPIAKGVGVLKSLASNERMEKAAEEIECIEKAFAKTKMAGRLNLDFSIIDDTNYYNGIIFSGYVRNIPRSILSGGRYDNLLVRMKKKNLQAIGFAVYFDDIERYYKNDKSDDIDTLIVWKQGGSIEALNRAVDTLSGEGKSFRVACSSEQTYCCTNVIYIESEEK